MAREILSAFARRTGLEGAWTAPRRYLWTDAFAVCAWLELFRETGERGLLDSALALVDQVHRSLGRHRPDDPRAGWISGLDEDQGRRHPTRGGLRIGKRLPERRPAEPFDERIEWDRDGQYFHYLTRWMHALGRVAQVAGEPRFLRWAVELARAAHRGFIYAPRNGGHKRMVWKASIDLSRPLVASMGAHDPLDGLLTFRDLEADARRAGLTADAASLGEAIGDLRSMCLGVDWTTDDSLGLGGLLVDALRLARLTLEDPVDAALLPPVVDGAARGLARLTATGALHGPARARLAFRELGLAIGLHALPHLARLVRRGGADLTRDLEPRLERLLPLVPMASAIEAFWLDPARRSTSSWKEHLDIDEVMLATSLVPEGYLAVDPPRAAAAAPEG